MLLSYTVCAHWPTHTHPYTPQKSKGFKYLTQPSLALKLSPSRSADGRPILPAPAHLSRRGGSGELYREEQKQRNGRRGPVPDLATVPSSQATISLGNNAQPPKMGAHNMKNVYSECLAQRRQEVLANPSIQVLCIFLLQRLSRCR